MTTTAPTSISAVESGGKSYLFYARANGQLAYLKAQGPDVGDPTALPYKTTALTVNGENVSAGKSVQITAVAYELDGKREIRVYYIDENLKICELCQTNGGDWYTGSLDSSFYQVAPDSLLTANIEDGSGKLKIFFQLGGSGKEPWVAWVVRGETSWSRRQISDKF